MSQEEKLLSIELVSWEKFPICQMLEWTSNLDGIVNEKSPR